MSRKGFFSNIAIALSAAVVFGAVTPARAAFTVQISINGGSTFSTFTLPGAGTVVGTVVDGLTSFTVIATSNSPGVANSSQIQQVQINSNNVGSAPSPTVDLVVRISDVGFMVPPTNSNAVLSSSFSGTTGPGITTEADKTNFQSFADFSNTLFGGISGVPTVGPTASTPIQDFSIPVVTSTTNFGGTQPIGVNVSSVPFSMSNEFQIGGLSIGAGDSFQLTGTSQLAISSPEPASIFAALAGLPVLGGYWVRRRKAAATLAA